MQSEQIHLLHAKFQASQELPNANSQAHIYEVLYQGYCAASRVELCLSVGDLLELSCWCHRFFCPSFPKPY